LAIPSGTVHIARSTLIHDNGWFQRLQISNFGGQAVTIQPVIEFASDFADIFEVRGTSRKRRGEMLPPEVGRERVVLGYRGLDDVVRRACFDFAPAPLRLGEREVAFEVRLEAQQTKELYLWVSCLTGNEAVELRAFETALATSATAVSNYVQEHCEITTSNALFNDWITRSQSDLGMLLTETPYGAYPYAGVPWFSTAFGRDGIWTALELLWVAPHVAKGVLRFLSAHQAATFDPESDAEPGKILHEMREGEMAALREIPFGCYYGSIDSTPLYLMLAARYYEATSDRALIEEIWPNLLKAAEWMYQHGDVDNDGFLEYGRRSKDGLLQQGWKDSHDSVFHRDGTSAHGPIALCEVQGYAYAARLGMALLSRVLGDAERGAKFEHDAEKLRERFDRAFWCEELSTYALALDAKKLPCRVQSSNSGHCLYTGIALPSRAGRVAEGMLSSKMFSGWGIRTLASDEQRHNPMSYHNGSIWPHDNAIIAEGLSAYGFRREASQILSGMFDASLFAELHRLPELFCGFTRKLGQGPTPYPVACSPQAWAAGAVYMLLKAVLGLDVSAIDQRVTFRSPVLPPFLEKVELRKLRVGNAFVDIALHRYPEDVGVSVLRKTGAVEIVMLK
jgi:glycogen debranching enzyme